MFVIYFSYQIESDLENNCESDLENTLLDSIREEVSSNINIRVNDQLTSLLRGKYLGQVEEFPASSCREILEVFPNANSGDYWIVNQGDRLFQAYCNMDLACGPDSIRGWMRVANVNLSDPSQNCPPGNFHFSTTGSIRYCLQNNAGYGCESSTFSVLQVPYTSVCGRATGVQIGTVDVFLDTPNPMRSIDDVYLDGISLTYGNNPRKHIWSFVASISENLSTCPCSNYSVDNSPSYVGDHYFCESGYESEEFDGSKEFVVPPGDEEFPDDLLWDGKLCNSLEMPCCGINFNPPWFYRDLGEIRRVNDIEMRLCKDQGNSNYKDEDVGLRELELYIQ